MSLHSLLLFGLSSLSMYVAVRGCSCMMSSYRDQFCSADFAIRGIVTHKSQVEYDSPDFFTAETTYDVTIYDIYKRPTEVWFQRGDEVVLWTPSSGSMCGVSLEVDTDYFITGTFDKHGNMKIHLCDWQAPIMSLDASQYAGIKGDYVCKGEQ